MSLQSVYSGAVKEKKNLITSVQDHFSKANYAGQNKTDFYRHYNKKLTEQFQNLLNNKGRDIYQTGLIDQKTDGLDKLLVNSEHINPLLKTLEDENKVLKQEIGTLSGDLKKFISMVELLLEENKYIREHINQKNRDITKLVETIGLNDGEEIHDLKHKIHILTEENNILIKHLDEMKKFREDYDDFVLQNEVEMEKARQMYDKALEDLELAKKREEQVSKQLAIYEPNYWSYKQKVNEQEEDIERKGDEIRELRQENETIQQEMESLQRNLDDIRSKTQYDNDHLLQENHKLNNEKKDLRQKINLKDKKITAVEDEYKKMKLEYQQMSAELQQVSSIVNEFENKAQIERSRAETSVKREQQMNEKLVLALNETEKATLKLQQFEKSYNNILEQSKQDLEEKHAKYEAIIENLKSKNQDQVEEREEKNNALYKVNNEQKRVIDKQSLEIEIKNKEIAEYKEKLVDYQHQKVNIDNQRLQLQQNANEIQELTNLLNDYKAHMQSQPEVREEQNKLLQQIDSLENKIQNMIQEGQDMISQNEYQRLELDYQHETQKTLELQSQIDQQNAEIRSLKEERDSLLDAGVNSRLSKKDQDIRFHEVQHKAVMEKNRLEDQIRGLEAELRDVRRQMNSRSPPQYQQQQMTFQNSNNTLTNTGNFNQQQQDNVYPNNQAYLQSNNTRSVIHQVSNSSPYKGQSTGNQFQNYLATNESPSQQVRSSRRIFDSQPKPKQHITSSSAHHAQNFVNQQQLRQN